MAHIAIDHRARARRAWPYLVGVARRGDKITYGDLTAKLGLHHRAASWLLGVIQSYCQKKKLPPLQAVAVNKQSKVPGKGYVGSSRSGPAYERTLAKVYAFPWQTRAPF